VHLPAWSQVLAAHDVPQIEEAMPTEVMNINCIESRLSTPQKSFDLDTLLHIRQTSLHGERQPYWYLIITTTSCALVFLTILYFCLFSWLRHFLTHVLTTSNFPTSNPALQASPSLTPVPERIETATEMDLHQENITFTDYSLR